MADEVVYALVKEVFDNLEEFKKMNAAYKGLTRESMLEGLTAPLHPGAEKFFKEKGVLSIGKKQDHLSGIEPARSRT